MAQWFTRAPLMIQRKTQYSVLNAAKAASVDLNAETPKVEGPPPFFLRQHKCRLVGVCLAFVCTRITKVGGWREEERERGVGVGWWGGWIRTVKNTSP